MNILTKTFLLWLKMNILVRLVSMQLKTTDKNKEKKVRNVQALLDMDDHTIREKIIDCISQLTMPVLRILFIGLNTIQSSSLSCTSG